MRGSWILTPQDMYISYKMTMLRKKHLDRIIAKEEKVNEAAFALDVRRETVSRWLAKYKFEGIDGITPKKSGPKKGKAHNRTNDVIEEMVIEIAKKNPFKGPQWIADELPVYLHQTTVYRILKRRGTRYGLHYKHKRRKKIAYCLDRPGRELQLDVCFPFGYSRKEVVYDAIDDCSRWVFAKVMPSHDLKSTIAFLEELICKAPFTIEAFRTDQGREFPKKMTEWLNERGINHRKNPPYTPQHNGKIERYHRTFKENEAVFWNQEGEINEFNYRMSLWLQHYNFNRKHGGLGMNRLTPAQKIIYSYIIKSFTSKNVTGTLQQNI